jgi:hypothetical protein
VNIDEMIPSADVTEFHARVIDAPVVQVWRAFVSLPVSDLRLARLLMALRALPVRLRGRPVPASAVTFLDASPVPLLDTRVHEYALAGGIGRPWSDAGSPAGVKTSADVRDFREPGWAKIGTDFRFTALGERTLMSTETRVSTTDPVSRRRMGSYWWLIRPFSGIIRREILRQTARRALSSTAVPLQVGPS